MVHGVASNETDRVAYLKDGSIEAVPQIGHTLGTFMGRIPRDLLSSFNWGRSPGTESDL